MIKLLFVLGLVLCFNQLFAQQTHHVEKENLEKEPKHLAGIFIGNTIIVQSNYQMPTVGIEYIRELNHRIGIGLLAEFEIGSHIIQKNEAGIVIAEVERESAFLLLPSVFVKVYKGLILTTGYGVEFEKNENIALFKLGLEYKLKMNNPKWAIFPQVSWDHTKIFDGVVYGVTFGYMY